MISSYTELFKAKSDQTMICSGSVNIPPLQDKHFFCPKQQPSHHEWQQKRTHSSAQHTLLRRLCLAWQCAIILGFVRLCIVLRWVSLLSVGYSGDAAGHCFMLTLTCGNGRDRYGSLTRPEREQEETERETASAEHILREHRFGNGLKHYWIKETRLFKSKCSHAGEPRLYRCGRGIC